MTFEYLCLFGFCHLNLPVVLQYFLCCRYLTRQATKDFKLDQAEAERLAEEAKRKKESEDELFEDNLIAGDDHDGHHDHDGQ